jgi:tRNA(Arg) A34 adenosine deaminase TadA
MEFLIEEMKDICFNYNHEVRSKHVAIVIKNTKILSEPSFNYLIENDTIHAEISAMQNFLKKNKKTCDRMIKKISLIVLRVNRYNELVNSKPCYHCLEYLKNIGIKNIYFSDDNGNIIKEKTKYMKTEHITRNRRIINRIII